MKKEKVVVQASTVTDENGSYTIFLESDTYNIVGYKNNYNPGCARIETVSGTTYGVLSEKRYLKVNG